MGSNKFFSIADKGSKPYNWAKEQKKKIAELAPVVATACLCPWSHFQGLPVICGIRRSPPGLWFRFWKFFSLEWALEARWICSQILFFLFTLLLETTRKVRRKCRSPRFEYLVSSCPPMSPRTQGYVKVIGHHISDLQESSKTAVGNLVVTATTAILVIPD